MPPNNVKHSYTNGPSVAGMDLTLQQLRMLQALDAHGTIAAAADVLGYTPSAVSQQLSAAEKSAAVDVLERSGRNVLLTQAGRELVGYANVVLSQMEEAQAAMERAKGEVTGLVRLGVIESIASATLARLLELLGERHPGIELRTHSADFSPPFDMIRSGDLDLAFVVDYPDAPGPLPNGVSRERVLHDWFRLVVPTRRAGEFAPGPIDLATLASERFIAPPMADACGRAVIQGCRRAGFEVDVAHSLADYPLALRMVAKGVAVALVPDLGLRVVPEGVTVLELADPFCRAIDIAHRVASAERPAIRATVQAIRDVLGELGLGTEGPSPSDFAVA